MIDAAAVAAGPGVMQVQICDALVSEETPDPVLDLPSRGHVGTDHEARARGKCTGHEPATDHLRHLIDPGRRVPSLLANVERPGRPIGRNHVEVQVPQQDQPLARFGIDEADPAGITGLGIGDAPAGAVPRQAGFIEIEECLERLERQARNAETNAGSSPASPVLKVFQRHGRPGAGLPSTDCRAPNSIRRRDCLTALGAVPILKLPPRAARSCRLPSRRGVSTSP